MAIQPLVSADANRCRRNIEYSIDCSYLHVCRNLSMQVPACICICTWSLQVGVIIFVSFDACGLKNQVFVMEKKYTGERSLISPASCTCPNPESVFHVPFVVWAFALFTIGPLYVRVQRFLLASSAKPPLLLKTLYFFRPGSGCATPAARWILAGFAYKATLIGTFPSFLPHISDHLVYSCWSKRYRFYAWLMAFPANRVETLLA